MSEPRTADTGPQTVLPAPSQGERRAARASAEEEVVEAQGQAEALHREVRRHRWVHNGAHSPGYSARFRFDHGEDAAYYDDADRRTRDGEQARVEAQQALARARTTLLDAEALSPLRDALRLFRRAASCFRLAAGAYQHIRNRHQATHPGTFEGYDHELPDGQ